MRCVDCLPLIEDYFDGEVEERTAAQMSAHLSACADCSAALDALSFEQEAYARYDRGIEVTPALWARVSAEIAREPFSENRIEDRPFLSRVRASLAAALSTLNARPALASALALLLVGVAAGSLWLAYVRRDVPLGVAFNNTQPAPDVPAVNTPPSKDGGEKSSTAAPSVSPSEFGPVRREDVREAEAATLREPKRTPEPHDDSMTDAQLNALLSTPSAAQQGGAGVVTIKYDPHERAEDSPAFVNIGGTDRDVVTTSAQLLDPEEKEVARHVEQAQMLLRSIKNARAEGGDTFNVAYEKRLSRRLLSENATLQLDAETRGDKDTKQVLDRIEPYLLDIANMHDNASREEVRSMRERIERKEIIAALQVY
jgi:hypothetical protein